MKGDKGLMGICRESEKGVKGEPGPRGETCNLGEITSPNTTYTGQPGPKGMEGPKVRHRLIAAIQMNRERYLRHCQSPRAIRDMKGRPDYLASEVSKASEVIWASKVKKDCPDRPDLV